MWLIANPFEAEWEPFDGFIKEGGVYQSNIGEEHTFEHKPKDRDLFGHEWRSNESGWRCSAEGKSSTKNHLVKQKPFKVGKFNGTLQKNVLYLLKSGEATRFTGTGWHSGTLWNSNHGSYGWSFSSDGTSVGSGHPDRNVVGVLKG